MTTRRDILASMIGAAAFATPIAALAQNRAIGDIRLDLSTLRTKGWGGRPLAVIDSSLRRALAAAFGPPVSGAPTLVVRLSSVTLSSYTGGGPGIGRDGRSFGDGASDFMEGDLILVARGNTIISTQPLLNALSPAGTGAAWWSDTNELRRLDALAASYGYWAARKLA